MSNYYFVRTILKKMEECRVLRSYFSLQVINLILKVCQFWRSSCIRLRQQQQQCWQYPLQSETSMEYLGAIGHHDRLTRDFWSFWTLGVVRLLEQHSNFDVSMEVGALHSKYLKNQAPSPTFAGFLLFLHPLFFIRTLNSPPFFAIFRRPHVPLK